MRVHSIEKIKQIKELRLSGLSIQQIMSNLLVPKTTVWHHIRGINLSDSQKAILRSNQGGSKKRKIENVKISEKNALSLLNGKYREPAIIISMLYWAEGHKNDRCQFTNTDSQMVALYLKILRDILGIQEQFIGITIRIFTGMNESLCRGHWALVTKISRKKIKMIMNDGGTSGKTKYGICRVTVLKGHSTLKLMHALIKNISKAYIEY